MSNHDPEVTPGVAPAPLLVDSAISNSLLILRLGVALVFMMWTIDKLINPAHASSIYERYYAIGGMGHSIMIGLGVAQLLLVLAFLTGTFRTWSYGLITILHAVSTASCYKQYLNPWEKPNLLFYAAFPMLSACVALWLMRKHDTLTIDHCLFNKNKS